MAEEIDGKTVRLRAFKGMLIRPDAPSTGLWATIDGKPSQWRGGLYDAFADDDARTHHRATKLENGRYTFTNLEHDCINGSDAGQYTPAINLQHYYKPSGVTDAGDLEQYRVYDGNENGALEAQIEQTTDENHPSGPGRKFFTAAFTVEVV
jgi:hypothetical protein